MPELSKCDTRRRGRSLLVGMSVVNVQAQLLGQVLWPT